MSAPADLEMTFEVFEEEYGLTFCPPDESSYFREWSEVEKAPNNLVWTVVEDDEENLWILPGVHPVNQVAFTLTTKPWTDPELRVFIDTQVDF